MFFWLCFALFCKFNKFQEVKIKVGKGCKKEPYFWIFVFLILKKKGKQGKRRLSKVSPFSFAYLSILHDKIYAKRDTRPLKGRDLTHRCSFKGDSKRSFSRTRMTRSHVAACVPHKSVGNIEPCKGYLFIYFYLSIYLFDYLFNSSQNRK